MILYSYFNLIYIYTYFQLEAIFSDEFFVGWWGWIGRLENREMAVVGNWLVCAKCNAVHKAIEQIEYEFLWH